MDLICLTCKSHNLHLCHLERLQEVLTLTSNWEDGRRSAASTLQQDYAMEISQSFDPIIQRCHKQLTAKAFFFFLAAVRLHTRCFHSLANETHFLQQLKSIVKILEQGLPRNFAFHIAFLFGRRL